MKTLPRKDRPRILRLLPMVIALGAIVLVLKSTDLVREAYAQAASQVAALTDDPVPANKDFAGDEDDQISSASEADVINSLAKRRRELDTRESDLKTQANMLAAAEARVDDKIAQLKQLQAQINALLSQRDQAQKDQIASLVKTYSTMKAKDAARIFDSLPDEVLLPVAQNMKSDVLALILANMNSDNAKALTVKLATKLTLPQTTDAIAPTSATPSLSSAATGPANPPTPAQMPPAQKRAQSGASNIDTGVSGAATGVAASTPAPGSTASAAAGTSQNNQSKPKT